MCVGVAEVSHSSNDDRHRGGSNNDNSNANNNTNRPQPMPHQSNFVSFHRSSRGTKQDPEQPVILKHLIGELHSCAIFASSMAPVNSLAELQGYLVCLIGLDCIQEFLGVASSPKNLHDSLTLLHRRRRCFVVLWHCPLRFHFDDLDA